jgi:hypothetical protein
MINMIEYIKNITADFPKEIVAIRTGLAADHLFTVRDKSLLKPMPKNKQGHFIMLLFLVLGLDMTSSPQLHSSQHELGAQMRMTGARLSNCSGISREPRTCPLLCQWIF